MSIVVTSLALGSLYCMIAVCFIFVFSIERFLDLSLLGYISLAPYVTAAFAGPNPGHVRFFLALAGAIVVIFLVSFSIDKAIYRPLEHANSATKVIASTCILVLILTVISIVWPSGVALNNPLDVNAFSIGGQRILYIDVVSVIVAVALLTFGRYFLVKTDAGRRVRAVVSDSDTAYAYGISRNSVSVALNFAIALLCTVTGVLLGSPGSPRSGVISVASFALVSLAVVIIARHGDFRACIIGSFIIAFAQTYTAAHLNNINDYFIRFLDIFNISTEVTLGPTFADRFVPFIIALVASVAIPKTWIKEVSHD